MTGQPYLGAMERDQLHNLAGLIEAALDLYDLPPDESVRPRPLPALRAAVREANRKAQAAQYRVVASGLPALLAELHAAAHLCTGPEQVEAWGLLAEGYRLGHSFGISQGMTGLSAQALARMDWAAQRAGDREPGLRAAREYLRITAYLRNGDYAACRRLNDNGVRHLGGSDAVTPGALVARGQLHLGASVIAARTGDRDAVQAHLDEAERLAKAIGEGSWETFWFGFGPTNVQVHRVMAQVEAGEYGKAVEAAEGLRFPTGWLPSRIGHHHIDMARAYQWMNRPAESLEELRKAQRVAPQQARYHPSVRETVSALVRAERRRTDALSSFAAWVGV
ncbi:transcriptional regulator [Peterkaempfera bronchialis]|uniref:transcriptional regulator n=1 Tax=Peterkaempfera bronchialis TaxID=2126346 RepID=UPI003C2E63F5